MVSIGGAQVGIVMGSATAVRMASRGIVGVRIAGVSVGVAAPERAALSPLPRCPSRPGGLRAQVSRAAPPALPGGYKVGDQVFFTGASETFPSGDKLVHGQQGEVTGPAALETHKGKGVAVRFPGNKGNVECLLTQVRRPRAAPAARAHAYVAPL